MFQPLAPWCSLHALLAVPLGATEPGPGVGVCVCVCGGGCRFVSTPPCRPRARLARVLALIDGCCDCCCRLSIGGTLCLYLIRQ